MNTRILLPGLTTLLALLASGCGLNVVFGSGRVVTETRAVSDFSRVELLGSGEVILAQGTTEGLQVEAEDNLMSHLRTEVRGHTLYLGLNDEAGPAILQPTKSIKYYVSLKTVEGLALSGSGNITTGPLTGDNLELTITGSGNIFVDTAAVKAVKSAIRGSGRCEVRGGTATAQDVEISGSGNYAGEKLETATGQVRITGSGKATVWAKESLDARISGSGDVYYYGTPQVTERITGSGDVRSEGAH